MGDGQYLDGRYPLLPEEYAHRYTVACNYIRAFVEGLYLNQWYQTGQGNDDRRTLRFCVLPGAAECVWVVRANARQVLSSPHPHTVAVDLHRLNNDASIEVAAIRRQQFGIVGGNIDNEELRFCIQRVALGDIALQQCTLNELRVLERQLLRRGLAPVT